MPRSSFRAAARGRGAPGTSGSISIDASKLKDELARLEQRERDIDAALDDLVQTHQPKSEQRQLVGAEDNGTALTDIGCLLYTSPSPRDRG